MKRRQRLSRFRRNPIGRTWILVLLVTFLMYSQVRIFFSVIQDLEEEGSETFDRSSTQSSTLRMGFFPHPLSKLASAMYQHQSNCSLPLGNFKFRNRFGLGSDLHVWSTGLCNSMHYNVRIRTVFDWLWMDEMVCNSTTLSSPMQCYFPESELLCPGDKYLARTHPIFDDAFFNLSRGARGGSISLDCDSVLKEYNATERDISLAAMEMLFGKSISNHVIKEAERQYSLVFGSKAPSDLITVHIRWGDKKREMKLVAIEEYIWAVYQFLEERPRKHVNIFLATEDPEAVSAFTNHAPPEWNIYIDQFYKDLLPQRSNDYNGVPKASLSSKGRIGTIALGSLLVAMESNEFVLTTESNWSRLINELRLSILDPFCDYCTKVIDLKRAKF